MNAHRRVITRTALTAGSVLVLLTSACSSGSPTAAGASGPAAVSTSVSAAAASSSEVTVTDQWVRATKGIADPTMTTVFGQFTNHTGKDLTIVSATNSLTARTELHQMTMNGDAMVMGPVVGGIKLPANKTTSLDPNTLHIMMMDLKSTILPGDEVKVTAKLSDGSTVAFDALGKEFAGGNESYVSGSAAAGSSMAPMTDPTGMTNMPGMVTPSPTAAGNG